MDSKDKVKVTSNRRFRKSFIHAVTGVKTAILEERHMRVHITAGMIVIICGVFFKVTKIEWLFLIFSIFNVLTFEMINTAIERAVDVATEDFHPYAKKSERRRSRSGFTSFDLLGDYWTLYFYTKIILKGVF
ncbi:hypothetical protein PCORN_15666 [Listeria cornellensis FSL F6-0969]|uniref:Diacylglycerol kinase n=1 Tax=Listeria cornellensis FSL F6-0969 TaxID=1265820 RepID=W7C0K1_9LIST|nr:diacylglycerol kinase family protein [Listeria cornellensis]EUJ26088.1 hypothetical protein PCORN_15666 [Listeria cornellensis FSL F6-0969]